MGGRGGGGGANVNAGVPASSRKVVQSLKEIVNCSDLEIYAMLVECDMDPDEAVNRLLSQDTFHEVKSKRDKKKETKDPADSSSWSRSIPNRGARSGNDNYSGRGGGNKYTSNDTGNAQGIPTNRRENGSRNQWTGSSVTSGVLGRQPPLNSDPTSVEVKRVPVSSSGDAVPSSVLPSSGNQSSWVSTPGQRTMADIVKMGRPIHQNIAVPRRSSETQNSSKDSGSKPPFKEEWPSIEKPDAPYQSSILNPSADSKISADQFSTSAVRTDQHLETENLKAKDYPVESPDADQVRPASVSSRNLHDDDSRDSSLGDENNTNAETYQPERHHFEHNEAEDASASVAAGFQKLTIENEDQEGLLEEEEPAVKIPDHLQIHTPECMHLMFGSFGAGVGAGQATGFQSESLNDNSEETPEADNNSSFRQSNTRETDFYGEEEQHRNATTHEQAAYQIDSSARNYPSSSDSETEQVQHEVHEQQPPQEDQYKFSSAVDYGFENSQQMNPALSPSETAPQMQNLDNFPHAMQQAYTSSLPNTLLPSAIQDVREPDHQYSSFPFNQSLATKYSTTASALSAPAICMAEALRAANISTPQATQQHAMPGAANAATGQAALAQHLALNPYSQPGLPLGHYANMISYPFLPQSYPYMPSAFQQAFTGNNTYHQSLAAMLPQYKTQSTTTPSGYGFGASSNIPGGNFPLNPSSTANSTIGYEDVLSSQFKDTNHLASLQQQSENSQAWPQGPNSRVLSGVPGSAYYSFPGHQTQQPPGFRQGQLQQPTQQQQQQQQQQQHFGGHSYLSPYHSQAGMSLEHHQHHQQHQQQHQQQQDVRDASLGQSHASKQTHQHLWPKNY